VPSLSVVSYQKRGSVKLHRVNQNDDHLIDVNIQKLGNQTKLQHQDY